MNKHLMIILSLLSINSHALGTLPLGSYVIKEPLKEMQELQKNKEDVLKNESNESIEEVHNRCITKGGEYLTEIDRIINSSEEDVEKAKELLKESEIWMGLSISDKEKMAEIILKSIKFKEKREDYKKSFARGVLDFCSKK